jgi:predicted dehydrogenase
VFALLPFTYDKSTVPSAAPSFPSGYRPGIAIVGCGGIVKLAHLPAYTKYGVRVVGVYDPAPEATQGLQERFPVVERIFGSLEELFNHPDVEVVDIATHPAVRLPLMQSAIAAGKHVLAQKPLALRADEAREVLEEAERRGVTVAVNQNARWAPAWRVATLLVQDGAVGDVHAVTHLHDHDFHWIVGTVFDEIPHFAIYDFSNHWIDITRCWLDGKAVAAVRAVDYRTPNQPEPSKGRWGAWVAIDYDDGSSGLIRCVGSAVTQRPGNPFWIHGSEGTIRGSLRKGTDYIELERDGVFSRFVLEGEQIPDGFAGTLGELLSAIHEKREPFNSARHNLLTLQMTLAACKSADEGGRAVSLDEIAC